MADNLNAVLHVLEDINTKTGKAHHLELWSDGAGALMNDSTVVVSWFNGSRIEAVLQEYSDRLGVSNDVLDTAQALLSRLSPGVLTFLRGRAGSFNDTDVEQLGRIIANKLRRED